ncbi:MAG: hypothetical protein IJM15_04860 [Erysipelotrichaceae bacterium]|nr:hypothetical protein [Erysipelotrichaceae bacterium]
MKENKTLVKIIATVIALAVIVFAGIKLKDSYLINSDGKIEVLIVNLENVEIKHKTIRFREGDTLVKLLEDNFDNVLMKDGMLMNIETLETPADWSSFICIYVDDKMSEVGIEQIKFTDGTKISLVMTELVY